MTNNLTSAFACLTFITTITTLPAFAQIDTRVEQSNTSVQQKDSLENPLNFSNQKGTSELQLQVLREMNHDLMAGSLTPEEASVLKIRINKLNDAESGYQSLGHPISSAVVEQNARELRAIASKLHRVPALNTSGANALHFDVDDMISRKLAENKITSGEAEKYYLRLAQIESNIESSKTDQGSGRYDAAAMQKSLAELRADLVRR